MMSLFNCFSYLNPFQRIQRSVLPANLPTETNHSMVSSSVLNVNNSFEIPFVDHSSSIVAVPIYEIKACKLSICEFNFREAYF